MTTMIPMSRDSAFDMASYLDATRDYDLLSAAEEKALSEAIGRGDRDARSRMIHANLRLVIRVAREFRGRGLPLEDLVSEGNLGLIRAVKDFDPRFGTRFSTYASYWIKQSIRHALLNTEAAIRLPAHMATLLRKWRRARTTLRGELNREPSAEEIGNRLALSPMQRFMVRQALRARGLRLDTDLRDHERFSTNGCADSHSMPDEEVEATEARNEVVRRLECLDDRERDVIRLRFGLAGDRTMTFKQIGDQLRMTREGARKIVTRALAKLGNTNVRERSAVIQPSAPGPCGGRTDTVGCDQSVTTKLPKEPRTHPRRTSQRSFQAATMV